MSTSAERRLVLVTGAGASVQFGTEDRPLPLMNGWSDALVDALNDQESGRASTTIGDDDDVAIAAITVADLQAGVLRAEGKRREARRAFVEEVLASIPVLEYDVNVAAVHADLLAAVRIAGEPLGAHDLIIAATARASGRMVVTADLTAFEGLPGSRHASIGELKTGRRAMI